MATEVLEFAKDGTPFLLNFDDEERLDFSDIDSSLEKLTKEVKDFIDLRAAIFMQKEEKIQQYQHDQLVKLKSEEEYYIDKCKSLENSLHDCVSQLKQIEYSFFDAKKRLAMEEEINKTLKGEISSLKTEKDDAKSKFQKTLSMYSTVIQWYEDYLKIHIEIGKGNCEIATLYFINKGINYNTVPYVKFEISQDFTVKILETHTEIISDKENYEKLYNLREFITFLYYAQEGLKDRRSSFPTKVSGV